MNRSLAQWLAGNPVGAIVATSFAATLPFLGYGLVFFLIGALPAFMVLERDTRTGSIVALGATLMTAVTAALLGRSVVFGIVYALWVLGPPLGLSILLARRGSLSLCVQMATVAAVALLIVLHAGFGAPENFFSPFVKDLAQQFQSQGVSKEEADSALSSLAKTLWGAIAVVAMLGAVLSVFVARWMQSVTRAADKLAVDPLLILAGGIGAVVLLGSVLERSMATEILKNLMLLVVMVAAFAVPRPVTEYSTEFQSLRLGLFLGAMTVLAIVVAFFTKALLMSDIVGLLLCAFVVVGFSAAHKAKARGSIGWPLLAVVYVLTLFLAPILVVLMAAWGFVDNWLRSQPPAPGAAA